MSLVPSLLQAIVRVDGDALVMHAGDKPYVVSPTGQIDLASRGLNLDAVNGIVGQLLPPELQHALDEFGAVQYELPPVAEFPGEHFTVVVARGGDDVWTEIRRRRVPDDDRVPEEFFGPSASAPTVSHAASAPPPAPVSLPDPGTLALQATDLRQQVQEVEATAEPEEAVKTDEIEEPEAEVVDEGLALPNETQLWPGRAPAARIEDAEAEATPPSPPPVTRQAAPPPPPPARQAPPAPARPVRQAAPPAPPPARQAPPAPARPVRQAAPPPPPPPPPPAPPQPVAEVRPPHPRLAPPSQPGVVLPISRNPIRADQPPPSVADPTLSGLERLLRLSAARGASTLYLSSQSRSSVRVDGELQMLEGEPELTARDVESLLLTLMPERSHEALRTGAATEWICDVEGVGRVRCMSFRDHRGPGGVFRLMPTRSVSAEQLGLPQQVQSLAIEPEGLVLVAGPRSSGKRTLMSAFVDLMNRSRRDHVITIEREINIVHERGSSFISQREVRGNDDDMLAAARAALREDPDVLVIEDLRTGALMNVALEAAASGHLVIGGFSAHTAAGAIDRIIDLYAPEYRRQVQLALADSLRGVIVQVLLRKTGGGRLPAREVLLNTPSVSSVIAEGKTSQLPMAIEGGRRYGMMPLNDALIGLVQSGAVDGREAYRQSPDRPGLLAALARTGIDTSFVERLA